MSPLSLRDVDGILSWQNASRIAACRDSYNDHLLKRLGCLCSRSPADTVLISSVSKLPPVRRAAVLRFPPVALMLCRENAELCWDGATFARLVAARLKTLGIANRPSVGLPRPLDVGIELDTKPGDGIPFPDGEYGLPGLATLGRAECCVATRKVSEALSLIARISPSAHLFAVTFIEILALRKQQCSTKHLYSSTFSGYVGLVRLTNPHLSSATVIEIADALVHEAIHGLLYSYEAVVEPLQCDEANSMSMISPWTGNRISLSSYVQACVVWYGLQRLWRLAIQRGIDQPNCSIFLKRALGGFAHLPVRAHETLMRRFVSPRLVDLLLRLERKVITESAILEVAPVA